MKILNLSKNVFTNTSSLFSDFFNQLNKKNQIILIANFIAFSIILLMQIHTICHYATKLPLRIIMFGILFLIVCLSLGIFSLITSINFTKTTIDLRQEKLNNQTLRALHDDTSAFKHDFSNIITSIGGYITTNDMVGLKNYYYELLQDCDHVKNLCYLSPDIINNPAIYILLSDKYYKADGLGIKIYLECFIDFNKLNMQIYEFARILGILMDNAIEAASECEEKIIKVSILNEAHRNRQVLTIENTYKDKDIDIEKIYEKGYSTKEHNTGLGLWEVNRIIEKHSNIARFSTKNKKFFKQQIEIYKE